MSSRIKKIYASLENADLDGLLVSFPANISYLTEFHSREAYLLASPKGNIYFTDSRYLQEAKLGLKGAGVVEKINGSFYKAIGDACKNLKLKRIGFEERHLPFAEYKKIKEELGRAAKLIPTHSLIEEFRQIKNQEEIAKIKRATQITIKALEFIKDFISPGKKELEVAAELERFIRYNGANYSAFEIIVASGPNSCFPHHKTSRRKLKTNEPVLIDLGVDYLGYKSDLTRVFFLGKISALARRVYDIVYRANKLAIDKVKPGIPIKEIDAAGRQFIAKNGYGEYFGHALGHGVGLETHEGPQISGKETGKLKAGMVFTIEPAVYLPTKFGIRIEDMVLVTRKGSEVLSGSLDK